MTKRKQLHDHLYSQLYDQLRSQLYSHLYSQLYYKFIDGRIEYDLYIQFSNHLKEKVYD